MVPSWQWSRRRISAPALQPQSVCAICLYIMQHPDTPVPRDSRVQRSAGATRSTRSAPRRGLGIFNLGLGPALVSLECVRRQSTAARHLVAQHLEGSRPQNANHQSQLGLVFLSTANLPFASRTPAPASRRRSLP